MAQQPEIPREIQRLIDSGAASRARISHDLATLRRRLDVPARIGHSFLNHPVKWLGGSLVLGFATSLLFRRKKVIANRRQGIRGILLNLVLKAVKPLAKAWLTGKLNQLLVARLSPLAMALSSSRSTPSSAGRPAGTSHI